MYLWLIAINVYPISTDLRSIKGSTIVYSTESEKLKTLMLLHPSLGGNLLTVC